MNLMRTLLVLISFSIIVSPAFAFTSISDEMIPGSADQSMYGEQVPADIPITFQGQLSECTDIVTSANFKFYTSDNSGYIKNINGFPATLNFDENCAFSKTLWFTSKYHSYYPEGSTAPTYINFLDITDFKLVIGNDEFGPIPMPAMPKAKLSDVTLNSENLDTSVSEIKVSTAVNFMNWFFPLKEGDIVFSDRSDLLPRTIFSFNALSANTFNILFMADEDTINYPLLVDSVGVITTNAVVDGTTSTESIIVGNSCIYEEEGAMVFEFGCVQSEE